MSIYIYYMHKNNHMHKNITYNMHMYIKYIEYIKYIYNVYNYCIVVLLKYS